MVGPAAECYQWGLWSASKSLHPDITIFTCGLSKVEYDTGEEGFSTGRNNADAWLWQTALHQTIGLLCCHYKLPLITSSKRKISKPSPGLHQDRNENQRSRLGRTGAQQPLSEVRTRGAWEMASLPTGTTCEERSGVNHHCVCIFPVPGNYLGRNLTRRIYFLRTQNHIAYILKIKTAVTISYQ